MIGTLSGVSLIKAELIISTTVMIVMVSYEHDDRGCHGFDIQGVKTDFIENFTDHYKLNFIVFHLNCLFCHCIAQQSNSSRLYAFFLGCHTMQRCAQQGFFGVSHNATLQEKLHRVSEPLSLLEVRA